MSDINLPNPPTSGNSVIKRLKAHWQLSRRVEALRGQVQALTEALHHQSQALKEVKALLALKKQALEEKIARLECQNTMQRRQIEHHYREELEAQGLLF